MNTTVPHLAPHPADALTGLLHRHSLEVLLAADHSAYALLLLGLDPMAHSDSSRPDAVGDATLRELGALLRANCRDADTPARRSEREFAVLMRGVARGAALQAAERLRTLVEIHDWSAVAPGLTVTVCIGVACCDEAAEVSAIVALADQRLYVARRDGRNRVVAISDA